MCEHNICVQIFGYSVLSFHKKNELLVANNREVFLRENKIIVRMTEIIIVAKNNLAGYPAFFFAPDAAILLITDVGNDNDRDRIFLSDTRGDIKNLKNIVV